MKRSKILFSLLNPYRFNDFSVLTWSNKDFCAFNAGKNHRNICHRHQLMLSYQPINWVWLTISVLSRTTLRLIYLCIPNACNLISLNRPSDFLKETEKLILLLKWGDTRWWEAVRVCLMTVVKELAASTRTAQQFHTRTSTHTNRGFITQL